MPRPFKQNSTDEIREFVQNHQDDGQRLLQVHHELRFRRTVAENAVRAEVETLLKSLKVPYADSEPEPTVPAEPPFSEPDLFGRPGANDAEAPAPDSTFARQARAAEPRIKELRSKLIETSGRNRLLNFKHTARGNSFVRVVNESLIPAFRHIRRDNASVEFIPLPDLPDEPEDEKTSAFQNALAEALLTDRTYLTEAAVIEASDSDDAEAKQEKAERVLRDKIRKKLGMPSRRSAQTSLREHAIRNRIDPDFDLSRGGNYSPSRGKGKWQTLLLDADLRRKLSALSRASREAQNELGIDTLNLVFGFLEWVPKTAAGEKKEVLFSPLVLQPVHIENCKPRGRGRLQPTIRELDDETGESRRTKEFFRITAHDADAPQANLTLRERLREDFGLVLPDLDPEEPNLEIFLSKIERAISAYPGWKVRQFITLTNLSFSRLPMWLDLDPKKKGVLPPHQNQILRELFGGRSDGDGNEQEGEEHRRRDAVVPQIVLDCDSSQYAAIKAVLSGRNLVIQGPPGTGKSQTIANIIAAAMGQGRSVLFVAEKQVALSVVQSRLKKVGLEDYLLELHSAKAGKAQVLESLRDRLKKSIETPGANQTVSSSFREQHAKSESILNDYIQIVNTDYGQTGLSLHHILWKHIEGRSIPIPYELELFEFGDCSEWTSEIWDRKRKLLKDWAEIGERLAGEPSPHPWFWVRADNLHLHEQRAIVHELHELLDGLNSLGTFLKHHDLCSREAITLLGISNLADTIEKLGSRPQSHSREIWNFSLQSDSPSILFQFQEAVSRLTLSSRIIHSITPDLKEPRSELSAGLSTVLDLLGGLKTKFIGEVNLHTLNQEHYELSLIQVSLNKLLTQIRLLKQSTELGVVLNDDLSSSEVVLLAELLSLRPKSLTGRQTTLYDEGAVRVLDNAVTSISQLAGERKALESQLFVSWADLDLEDIKHALAEYERAWFGSWLLNPEFRKARRVVNRSLRITDVKVVVPFLKRVLELAQEITTLEAHKAGSLLGGIFTGIDSDVSEITRISGWVSDVIKRTPVTIHRGRDLRRCILEASDDLHLGLLGLASGQFSDTLDKLERRYSGQKRPLSAQYDSVCSDIESLETAKFHLANYSWTGPFNSDRVKELESALENAEDSGKKVDELELEYPIKRYEIEKNTSDLKQLGEKFTAIRTSGLTDRWTSKLLDYDDENAWHDLHLVSTDLLKLREAVGESLGEMERTADVSDQQSTDWRALSISELVTAFDYSKQHHATIQTRCLQSSNRRKVENEYLIKFVETIGMISALPEPIDQLFDKVVYHNLSRQAFNDSELLRPFRYHSPSQLREEFRKLDKALIDRDTAELVGNLSRNVAPTGVSVGLVSERTEFSLIIDMCGKKRPKTPVRELLRRSGNALKALKPCFMMSPLSVAQLIDRQHLSFDLVIFDEASQIRPEDALSALMRGKQFVVVGDKMQLPPTSFGERNRSTGSIDDDEDENEEDTVEAVESILETAASAFGDGPMLMWHYRSRDPSLISFSNQEFYDNELQVFPAPRISSPDSGVTYVKVAGIYSARTNLIEAKSCAAAVASYIRAHPERSIGVVATNRPQADLIEIELERSLGDDDVAQDYLTKWEVKGEPLFVKNLESVQGDERDVIIISTVFGNDGKGAFFQRYGPINSSAGHRRLNVLFTRAKHHVIVISSIPLEKIQPKEGGHWGVRALKGYLEYARSGRLPQLGVSQGATESPFEDSVLKALTASGFQCKTQVGVRGFLIDIAVCNPANPDEFILGVECDGASYHSSKSARDRDRLRQEVLEQLGWHIHRVWSTDWFREPITELSNLLDRIRERVAETKKSKKSSLDISGALKDVIDPELYEQAKEIAEEIVEAPVTVSAGDNQLSEMLEIFRNELRQIEDDGLRLLMTEAFDLNHGVSGEIKLSSDGVGIIAAARMEEAYNQAVYLWLEGHKREPLHRMPWPGVKDIYKRVFLRMNAVRGVVARLR